MVHKYQGTMGMGANQPVVDPDTMCRGETCASGIAVRTPKSSAGHEPQILLAYNAAGHQTLSTEAIAAVTRLLPPNLKWVRRFIGDTATPTVYRDMTDIWTLAHWRATGQKHHFMRAENQSYSEAYDAAVGWIHESAHKAAFNLRSIWKEDRGYVDPLFVTEPLGDAFHALQDSFSAGHVDRRKLGGPGYVITAIHVYDAKNKETHSEVDTEWRSPLGEEAVVACRELTTIAVYSALRKSDEEFEAKWNSLWGTFKEVFLQVNFSA